MVLEFIVNMILLIGIVSLFNVTRYIFKIRKLIKKHKDNPNIQGITIVNGEVKVIEKKPTQKEEAPTSVAVEQVRDEICGQMVEASKAYRVLHNGEEHYFCSWECREAFMKIKQEEGK